MKLRYLSTLVLLATACTFTPQDNGLEAGFHPPLVYKHWHTEYDSLQNGKKICSISSGYNGLTVTLSPETQEEAVQSNRPMTPGTTFTVTIDGNSFETSESFFPVKAARALVKDLVKGNKAYLEWSEISGPTSSRVHIQNIVLLDDFKTQLKRCKSTESE